MKSSRAKAAFVILTAAASVTARRIASSKPGAAAGQVVSVGRMSVERASHTATLLPNGKVLIAGGFAGSGAESKPYSSVEFYDPATGEFTPAANMTVGRSGQTATMLRDGKVLLAGGWTGRYQAAGTAELYDPSLNTFTCTGRMVVPRADNTATLLSNGTVLIAGGVDAEENAMDSAEIYDPATGCFHVTGSMHQPRGAHTATLLNNGKVLITGGGSGHYPNQTIYLSAELYDSATGKFSRTGDMKIARHKHAAVLLRDGKALIIGGSDHRDWRGEYSSAELYDPAAGVFRLTGSMSLARFKIPEAAVLLDDGRVLVAGGAERAETYDPARGVFTEVEGTLGTARFFASATLLPHGAVLIAGGYADSPGGGLPSTRGAWVYEPPRREQ